MESKKEIVLVTGSSGCLGQFIVKLLQEQDDKVGEIRLYDRWTFTKKLDYFEGKKTIDYMGDIRYPKMLLKAMDDVDCVIHCAAVMDISVIPDSKSMYLNNVEGTQAVIDGCLLKNVPRLIFAGSTDLVCGMEHIFYGTESTTPIPTSFMIGDYAETKCRAEKMVLEANETLCANGQTVLKTVSLRPTPFYGENDRHFFLPLLRCTKRTNGFYHKVRSLDERLQISYVGNVAWAFLKAKDKLAVDDSIGGEAFFITDDTPIIDIHEHLQPYLEARGWGISHFTIPYWLAWIILSIICFFIKVVNIFYPWKPYVPSVKYLNYMCSTFFFNRAKATLRLDYEPIYTPEEAQQRSLPYYKNALIL